MDTCHRRSRVKFFGVYSLPNSFDRYVGSHCTVELLKHGFNVAILDNLSNSSKGLYDHLVFRKYIQFFLVEIMERIENLSNRKVPFHKTDLLDKESLKKVKQIEMTTWIF